jgi:Leucine-rich repeat (LRR) protein
MPHSSPFLERPHLGPLPCTLFWRSACANGLAFLLLGTCRTISGNPGLTGNLPPEIGSLTNLTGLDLHDNNFTGVIPNLAQLENLETLFLNGNAFTGSIEHVLQGLNTNLRKNPYAGFMRVDLSSNQLTGCIPGLTTGMGNFSGFSGTFLNVSHNHIGEYLSNTSTQFFQSGLSTLDLSYNNISGDISTFMSGILDCVVDIL